MTTTYHWQSLQTIPSLEQHEAHVWCSSLDFSVNELDAFFNLLSDDEKKRAQRFHFPKDQAHFTAARGLLRKILACYVNTDPAKLQFQYNQYGKPALQNHPDLQFNVSHSHGVALYAITHEAAIGVDIEFMERHCDMDGIVERYFSAQECITIKKLMGTEKTQAFFNGWARKEAFLKALGEGLSFPLAQVEVTLMPDQAAHFIALHDDKLNITEWQLYALEPVTNYAAALVVKGNLQKIKTGYWDII